MKNYQAKVEKLAPKIFYKMIHQVERMRGYRIFVFDKIGPLPDSRRSAYGNRGSLEYYSPRPYLVGNFAITGLDDEYFKGDRTLDIYFGNDIVLYFHSEYEIKKDSRIYVDRGNYFTDNSCKDYPLYDPDGLRFDYKTISSVNKMQCFMIDDIMNRMGYGKEIIQMIKLIPTELPSHLDDKIYSK